MLRLNITRLELAGWGGGLGTTFSLTFNGPMSLVDMDQNTFHVTAGKGVLCPEHLGKEQGWEVTKIPRGEEHPLQARNTFGVLPEAHEFIVSKTQVRYAG